MQCASCISTSFLHLGHLIRRILEQSPVSSNNLLLEQLGQCTRIAFLSGVLSSMSTTSHAPLFSNICSFLIFSIIQTCVRFYNSKFSLRQLSNLPRSCYTEPISVCPFQSWGRLIFFRKGFIYEAYQKYRSAPCGGDPLHYAVSLLRSVRAAMAVAYSHPHTSDSWRRSRSYTVFPVKRIWDLSFPFFFGGARLSPRLAGFYEKALHPHYAPVLCMYHGPSDLYVHTDVQQ